MILDVYGREVVSAEEISATGQMTYSWLRLRAEINRYWSPWLYYQPCPTKAYPSQPLPLFPAANIDYPSI